MTIEYSERMREPSRRQARWLFGGLSAFLLATTVAVGAEIASGDNGVQPSKEPLVNDMDVFSSDAQDAGFIPTGIDVLAARLENDPNMFKREDLKSQLADAEERVFFDGSPETVRTCKEVAAALSAISLVPVTGNCTL